jgi:NitT/TauT family transport system permease protein
VSQSPAALEPAVPIAPVERRGRRALDLVILLAVMLAVWQTAGSWTAGIAITPPLGTIAYLADLVRTPLFWEHVGATVYAFVMAFAISAVLGLLLGLVLGLRRFAGEVAEPILAGFYTIPKVTLYPVVLLVFGLGLSAKVAFGVMHGLVPVTLFTLGSVRNLAPVLVRTARVMRLSAGQAMWSELIPACLPDIVSGLRIGFSLTLLGVLIGEMFSSQRGLGFLLVSGLAQHNVPLTTAIVLVIVVGAVAANTLMLRFGRGVTHRA